MNKALVFLAFALALGLAGAPAVAASCPPAKDVYCGDVTPLGEFAGCVIDAEGDFVAEIAADCL